MKLIRSISNCVNSPSNIITLNSHSLSLSLLTHTHTHTHTHTNKHRQSFVVFLQSDHYS